MINKSFQLLRTNPLLTTNIKLVVSSDYKLYLESFDSNKQLSDTKYKHVIINKNKYLEDVISEFYRNLPVNIAYDAKYDDDETVMYSNFDNQFDDMYYSGAKNIEDQWHYEEFDYLAPLYVNPSGLPSSFIVLRVDEPSVYSRIGEIYRIESINKSNFKSELLDKWKCVKLFDLTKNSDIGVFLNNNYIENTRFPNKSFELDIKGGNFSRWFGMDYETGIYTQKSQILDDKLYYENPDFNLEEFITGGFKNNKLIYPNILNLKFLFDDTPATPTTIKKWSMNRYYGFYVDKLELVQNLTSYVTPRVKSNTKLRNNIFVLESDPTKYIEPFVETWNDKNAYFVYIDNNLYRVEKVTQNNTSVYKVISDKKLDDLYDSSKIYKNTIKIQYDDVTGRNYIVPYDAEFIVDGYIDKDSGLNTMYADLYVISIDGKYHVLKYDEILRKYYIQCDYAINSNEFFLEYWIGGKNTEYYTKKNIYNKNIKTQIPLEYSVYRIQFSDIKDFDFDRVNTHFSDFDYEKSTYYKTEEFKMYATEYRDISNPKSFKVIDYNNDGQYQVANVSSEYITTDELFEIKNNSLTDIWRKNQTVCKWGYEGSISHSDYVYKLNNNLKTGSVFNRTVNPFATNPNIYDKNLDYFYRVGNFYDIYGNTIYYYNQSTNISTDLLNQTHSAKFNLSMYVDSKTDYFSYFFNNIQKYDDFGKIKIKEYCKYSIFNSGDKYENSSTLFKGLKVNIHAVDNFILESDTDSRIRNILTNDGKLFNGYKFSILLNDRYSSYDYSDNFVETYNNGIQGNMELNSPNKNGIHIYLNDKYKNILVIININIPIHDNAIHKNLNSVEYYGEKYGLYYGKGLNGDLIYEGSVATKYNPSLLTAYNFINAINNMNSVNGFDDYITFYYIDELGNNAYTKINDYGNSTMMNIPNWNKRIPPFILSIETPNELYTKKKSYDYIPISGPEYNIYNKYKTNDVDKLNRETDIDDYLAREIKLNESDLTPMSQTHGENITYNNLMYRYSGSYSPIFKNVQLFKNYDIWGDSPYYFDSNYKFNLGLEKFGLVEEIQYSKVNRTDNLLKLKNADNDRSIYPMIDEFGYSTTSRFIFKSGWDNDYFIESTLKEGVGYDMSSLGLTLSILSENDGNTDIVYDYVIKNSSSIARNVVLKFSYTTPTGIEILDPVSPININIPANSQYRDDTRDYMFDLTHGHGTYIFKIFISTNEYSTTSHVAYPPLPTASFIYTNPNVSRGNTVTYTYNGNGATSFAWVFEGGTPSSSNLQNPTVTYNTTSGSPFDTTLTVSNVTGSDSLAIPNLVTVTEPVAGPDSYFLMQSGLVGEILTFTRLFEGLQTPPSSVVWKFEVRDIFGESSLVTKYGEVVTHSWSIEGNYLVSVYAVKDGAVGATYTLNPGAVVSVPQQTEIVSFNTSDLVFIWEGGTLYAFDTTTPSLTISNREWYFGVKNQTLVKLNDSSGEVYINVPENLSTTSDKLYTVRLKNNITNNYADKTIRVTKKTSCLSINTPIPLSDGTWKKIGDLQKGDKLKTFYIDGFIDESQPNWSEWREKDIKAKIDETTVKNIYKSVVVGYYILNNSIEVAKGHKFLIKKNKSDYWEWVNIENVEVGDSLLDINKKQVLVEQLVFIDEKLNVAKIDVEDLDGYFADIYFVHNAKPSTIIIE